MGYAVSTPVGGGGWKSECMDFCYGRKRGKRRELCSIQKRIDGIGALCSDGGGVAVMHPFTTVCIPATSLR